MVMKRQSGIAEISSYEENLVPRHETELSSFGDECNGSKDAAKEQIPSYQPKHNDINKPKYGSNHPVTGGGSSPSHNGQVSVVVPNILSFGNMFSGDATFYGSAGGGGACGFGAMKSSLPGIAIGADIFGTGEACGACVKLYPGDHGKPVIVTGEYANIKI